MEVVHGILATVTGEIVPYAFTNTETGEDIGGINLRIPGDVVRVAVPAELAEKMQTGEIWSVVGRCMVSQASEAKDGRKAKPAGLRVYEVHKLTRLTKARDRSAVLDVDWGDAKPAKNGAA